MVGLFGVVGGLVLFVVCMLGVLLFGLLYLRFLSVGVVDLRCGVF